MKKFNFVSQSVEKDHNAEIEVNLTKPEDFVGEVCVTKLKIPSDCLPYGLLEPHKDTISQETLSLLQSWQMGTPTDFIIGFVMVSSQDYGCNSTDQYILNEAGNFSPMIVTTMASQYRIDADTMREGKVWGADLYHFWIPGKISYHQNGTDINLSTPSLPFYDWNNGLKVNKLNYHSFVDSKFQFTDGRSIYIHTKEDGFEIEIGYRLFLLDQQVQQRVSTPILVMSEKMADFLGVNDSSAAKYVINGNIFRSPENATWNAIGQRLVAPRAKITYNTRLLQQITTNTIGSPDMVNFSCTFNLTNFHQTSAMFPINHVCVQCLDLNYEGEKISINTLDLTGTVVPSSAYFLKTFLISTDTKKSDFIFVNDMTTERSHKVNSPRITHLFFRLFWLDPANTLRPIILGSKQVFSIQLCLTEDSTKRVRFLE